MTYDEVWTSIPHSFWIFGYFERIKAEFLGLILGWILVWLRQLKTTNFVESFLDIFYSVVAFWSFSYGRTGTGRPCIYFGCFRGFLGAQYWCLKHTYHDLDFMEEDKSKF